MRFGHYPGGDIVLECEDGDSGLTDRESGSRNDRWQQPLEPFPRFG